MTDRPGFTALATNIVRVLAIVGALLWAGWVTRTVTQENPPQIVTVRLADTIKGFVDAAARAEADPVTTEEAGRAFVEAYPAVLDEYAAEGKVVLVAEAVLAGAEDDVTPELEERIAGKLNEEVKP